MTARRREALIVEHMPAAERIARRVHQRSCWHLDVNDVIQTGYVGLIQASKRYRPSLGPFDRFAYWAVFGAIMDATRRRKYREEMNDSLDAMADHLGYAPEHLTIDPAPLPNAIAERREVQGLLLVAILDLPIVEGAVLLGHLAGETLPEVGRFHQRSGTWAQGKLASAKTHVTEQMRKAA